MNDALNILWKYPPLKSVRGNATLNYHIALEHLCNVTTKSLNQSSIHLLINTLTINILI